MTGTLPRAANQDPLAASYRSNISWYSAALTPAGSVGGGTSRFRVTEEPGARLVPSGVAGPVVTTDGLSGLYHR